MVARKKAPRFRTRVGKLEKRIGALEAALACIRSDACAMPGTFAARVRMHVASVLPESEPETDGYGRDDGFPF